MAARVGAFSAPFIAAELKKFSTDKIAVPFIIMAIPALIASIVGIYLPETKDQVMDNISQGSSVGKDTDDMVVGKCNEGAEMNDIVKGDYDCSV